MARLPFAVATLAVAVSARAAEPVAFLNAAGHALQSAMMLTYAQGMDLLRVASKAYNYDITLADVARIWRGGCIIRSAFLEDMRAAYAAQRAEIGPRGYEDRIFRRKSMAKPAVRALTAEAERLLTLRENHRLNRIPEVPRIPAV